MDKFDKCHTYQGSWGQGKGSGEGIIESEEGIVESGVGIVESGEGIMESGVLCIIIDTFCQVWGMDGGRGRNRKYYGDIQVYSETFPLQVIKIYNWCDYICGEK